LCNLTITQATHPQNQAGNKHVSFASRQSKATLQLQTHDAMTSLKFTVVPHPPYSPDLAPSDFWLFPKLETLKGQHFSSDAEVEAAVCKWSRSQPETFIDGMKKKMCSRKW
jgi:histone-lysine N-methyltransferase SETMAR